MLVLNLFLNECKPSMNHCIGTTPFPFLGLVPVAVANSFGTFATAALLIMILMALLTTGSAEVVAFCSIMIYDIYMIYIKVSNH